MAIGPISNHSSTDAVARVSLGPGAPAEMADFLTHAGIDVLTYAQKHHASLYVDFVGARPPGVDVLSVDLTERGSRAVRPNSDLSTDTWEAAACLVVSRVLGFKPAMLTADSATLAVIKSAISVATSSVPVAVGGEIGTGKFNLARLIHCASRCRGSLFTINCASLDTAAMLSLRDLPEAGPIGSSALIAHLYFDELAELSDAAQVKFLQFLQTIERAPGADISQAGSLRLISATNRQLQQLVERGELRRELYWRLNVFSLTLPALRDRAGDVGLLARYFLHRANPRRMFTPMALKILGGYSFPGNVLELENLVTRLALSPLQNGNSLIDVPDVRRHLAVVPAEGEVQVSGWKSSREEARREMILKTIAAAGGNRVEAARRLGITTRALQYHITKAGLSRRRSTLARNASVVAPRETPIFDSHADSIDLGEPALPTLPEVAAFATGGSGS